MPNVLQSSEKTVFESTSLEPSETNGQTLGVQGAPTAPLLSESVRGQNHSRYDLSAAQSLIHARWKRERVCILDALDESTFGPIGRQRHRIAMCAYAPLLVATDDGKVTLAPGFCRQRMCPTCQQRRGREMTARVAAIAGTMNAPRFVTLTLKSSRDTLKGQLDRLYEAFRDLRRRGFWKAHVTAGVAVAEVTRNADTDEWHPHLHILVDGSFMPQAALSREWADVTAGSMIVDIRAVHDRRNAARYIAAYVAKPTQVTGWPPHAINEFTQALHGRRMLVTFGKAHRVKVEEDACETRPAIVEPLVSVAVLRRAISAGCPAAALAYDLLSRVGGVVSLATGHRPHPSAPPPAPLEPWEWEWLSEALRYVGGHEAAGADDACPFPDAVAIGAAPPRARPGTASPASSSRATLRVDAPAPA